MAAVVGILLTILVCLSASGWTAHHKECDAVGNCDGDYAVTVELLEEQFSECTIIRGDLEICHLYKEYYENMDFLDSIEVITGGLFIYGTNLEFLKLDHLREIGNSSAGLSVWIQSNPNLKTVFVPKLRNVRSMSIVNSEYLCSTKEQIANLLPSYHWNFTGGQCPYNLGNTLTRIPLPAQIPKNALPSVPQNTPGPATVGTQNSLSSISTATTSSSLSQTTSQSKNSTNSIPQYIATDTLPLKLGLESGSGDLHEGSMTWMSIALFLCSVRFLIPIAIVIIMTGILLGIYYLRTRRRKKREKRSEESPLISQNACPIRQTEIVDRPPDVPLRKPHAGFIQDDEFQTFMGSFLGEGNFGKVQAGELHRCGEAARLVAVKTLHVRQGQQMEKDCLLKEAQNMSKLSHKYILEFLGIHRAPATGQYMLFTELCGKGSLMKFLQRENSNRRDIPLKQMLTYCWQISEAMAYLKSMKITHRDLATRNVLIADNGDVKVADFGMSNPYGCTDYYDRTTQLPFKYMAPESLEVTKIISYQTDVWSFGITCWEIFTYASENPYERLDSSEELRCFLIDDPLNRLLRPSRCPPLFYEYIFRCWHIEPEERPTMERIAEKLGGFVSDPRPLQDSLAYTREPTVGYTTTVYEQNVV